MFYFITTQITSCVKEYLDLFHMNLIVYNVKVLNENKIIMEIVGGRRKIGVSRVALYYNDVYSYVNLIFSYMLVTILRFHFFSLIDTSMLCTLLHKSTDNIFRAQTYLKRLFITYSPTESLLR